MKIRLLILLLIASLGANAQSWTSFGTGAVQRRIVSGDTTYRWVGTSVGTYIYGISEWKQKQLFAPATGSSSYVRTTSSVLINPFTFGSQYGGNLGGIYGYDNGNAQIRPFVADTIAAWMGLSSAAYVNPKYFPYSNYTVPHTGIVTYGKKIAFFGDSYTEGAGATTTAQRWTTVLSSFLGSTEENFGVGGTTIENRVPVNYQGHPNMVQRISDIPTYTSDYALLVFAFGLNDLGQTAAAYNPTNYKTDYDTVLYAALNKGWPKSRVLLIPPYYIGAAGYALYGAITGNASPTRQRHLDFVEATKVTANKFNMQYFDIFQDQLANDTTLLTDGIHTNDAGHLYIARDIMQHLGQTDQHYNSTRWNGMELLPTSFGVAANIGGLYGYDNATGKMRPFTDASIRAWGFDASYLSLGGGTLTGPLVIGSSGSFTPNKVLNVYGTGLTSFITSGVTDNTTSSASGFTAIGTSTGSLYSHSSSRTNMRYGLTLGGWVEIFATDNLGTNEGIVIGNQSNKPMVFGTNNLERGRFMGTGEFLLGTTTSNGVDLLQVNGSILTTGLTLSTAPTTSAGGYDVLTRNTSTGKVEKIAGTFAGLTTNTFSGLQQFNSGAQFNSGTAAVFNNAANTFHVNILATGTTANRSITLPDASGTMALTSDIPLATSGTYTPTLTGFSNIASVTAVQSHYIRVGSQVTVTGYFTVTPTVALTTSMLTISLPIASAMVNPYDLAGQGQVDRTGDLEKVTISAETSSDTAQLDFKSGASTSSQTVMFSFTYTVI